METTGEALAKNQIHMARIEGYAEGGAGVARVGGRVVFVAGALRGERCRVRILKALKRHAYARVEEIIEPSPARVAPDCPNFPRCGGCALRHMSYEEELSLKRARVQDALRRLGGSEAEVDAMLGAPDTLRYRNKAIYPVSPDGRVGFYRARTHEVIDAPRCLLVSPTAEAAADALRDWMAAARVPGYDERRGSGLIRHLYVRTNTRGESLIAVFSASDRLPEEDALAAALRRACPAARGIVLGIHTARNNVILGEAYRTLWGEPWLEDRLCGLTFRLSVPSFYQVNHAQCERLYETAMSFAELRRRETILDLYCGAGTLTLALARRAGRVIGAEMVEEAVLDARANAARNGVSNAEFIHGDASEVAASLARDGVKPDVVTVDPPRKGLSEAVIHAIAAMGPDRVVYISCDPATLGRDLARFAALGYRASRAAAIDLFPRTEHVETVVLMSRVKAPPHTLN